jgi:hypothetical protein
MVRIIRQHLESLRQEEEKIIREARENAIDNVAMFYGLDPQELEDVFISTEGPLPESLKIVTIKLPKNSGHNPQDKVTGECPFTHGTCTDVTGEHHSAVMSQKAIASLPEGVHITRVEDL